MDAVVERLAERNRADVKLEATGLLVTVEPPSLRDFIVSDLLPLPVAEEIVAREMQRIEERPNPADPAAQFRIFRDNIMQQRVSVAMAVKAIDGEPVSLSIEDTSVFTDEEFRELAAYADRRKPLPGKG